MISGQAFRAQFKRKIGEFPFLNEYLSPSLTIRLEAEHWYENRVLRYILKGSAWIQDSETTFQQAELGSIPNSREVFDVLQGTEADYDEQLFDLLAEVRLVVWARGQGYRAIRKLKARAGHTTPDFRMEKDGGICLAEAKHFRIRDYLVYFVANRLEGLALKTGGLREFGLQVETASGYAQMRDSILTNRQSWIQKARGQLTEGALSSLEQSIKQSPQASIEILNGLFAVECSGSASPGSVFLTLMGMLSPTETVKLCLSRLRGELTSKLTQIKEFMDATGTQADRACVFFSGIDEWEPEWSVVWESLDAKDAATWKHIHAIRSAAEQVIGIPFDLIVGRYQKKGRGPSGEVQYGPLEYVPFPWQPENMSS